MNRSKIESLAKRIEGIEPEKKERLFLVYDSGSDNPEKIAEAREAMRKAFAYEIEGGKMKILFIEYVSPQDSAATEKAYEDRTTALYTATRKEVYEAAGKKPGGIWVEDMGAGVAYTSTAPSDIGFRFVDPKPRAEATE